MIIKNIINSHSTYPKFVMIEITLFFFSDRNHPFFIYSRKKVPHTVLLELAFDSGRLWSFMEEFGTSSHRKTPGGPRGG